VARPAEARGPRVQGAMLRDDPEVGEAALSWEAAGCRCSWDGTPTRTSWGVSNEKAAEIAAAAMVKPKPARTPPTETSEKLRNRVRAGLLRRRAWRGARST
jgi:hypothetical protein